MKRQKKIIFLCLIALVVILIGSPCIYAHVDDKINYIDIQVDVKENGNAIIEEKWFVNSVERFSYYKLFKGMDRKDIVDFSIKDESETMYNSVEKWDVYMPNEEKVGKCGINATDEGIELCWGVNKDGFHAYTLKYEIKNFVKNYKDAKGIKFDFIDEAVNPIPASIDIKISSNAYKFSKANTNAYNYGSKNEITFSENGVIELSVNSAYKYVMVLIELKDMEKLKIDNKYDLVFKDIKKDMDIKDGIIMKWQDILVISIIIICSVMYLILDFNRYIDYYKKEKEKILRLET